MITIVRLAHPLPFIITFFCVVRILKICSLRKLQVYDGILLTVVPMLYIWYPELTHLITESLYLLTSFLISFTPWQPPFYSLVLYVPWDHTVLVFLCLAYFSWHNVLQAYPCYHKWQDLFNGWIIFLCIICIYHICFIHSSVQQTCRVFSYLDFCEQCCSGHGCAGISLRYWFHFFWIYTQKRDCWIIW